MIVQGGPTAHIHDELHCRVLVLDDGRHPIAFAVCDVRMISRQICDRARQIAAENTSLHPDSILISATHSHSVPTPVGVQREPLTWPPSSPELLEQYEDFLVSRIADGIRRAVNNLEPAEIARGSVELPQHLFNRRWFVRSDAIPANPLGGTGDQVLMNPPAGSDILIRPAGPVDPEVAYLSVRSRDSRPIALLANYGLHYVGGIPRGHVSADYFGEFCRRLTALMKAEHLDPPFVSILSNGTSGDVNNTDFRKPRERKPPYQQMKRVADSVARAVAGSLSSLEYRSDITLGARMVDVELGVRLPSPEEIKRAREILKTAPEGGSRWSRPQIYARETLFMSNRGPVYSTPVQVFRIGPYGVFGMPCEVFAETGLRLKAESPLQRTFTIELANDYGGYLPTPRQHELGGYETWRARSSFLEVNAEPKLTAALLQEARRMG